MTEFPLPNFSVDLSDQVALVTGATSGLGWRFAEVLAASGAAVAAAGRRAQRLEKLCTKISDAGGRCMALPLDVTESEAVPEAFDRTQSALGPVNILVNNAGIPDAQYATNMSVELIDRVIATNLRAPYLLSCELARRLIARTASGRIVNIASAGAYRYGGNGAALYSITKAGLVRMTEVLSVEWAKFNINVNGIAPGAFSSEMMDGMIARVGDFRRHFPRQRLGEAPQLDSTLLYLVSPASEFVTGTIIKVDDGQDPK